jgi:hypothetical protein
LPLGPISGLNPQGDERVNEKISRAEGAPAMPTGRNVSAEIGNWLARTGTLDPDLVRAK